MPTYIDPLDLAVSALLKARQKAGTATYEQIAAETGIGLRTLKRIFNDERRPPTVGELHAIAKALGTTALDVASEAEGVVEDV